jgi:hypothetical protein
VYQDLGLKFNVDVLIDAFEWVPYFRFGAGISFPPKTTSIDPLLSAGFGVDGYFRFSFASDIETIRKGIERIADFVKSYR